MDIAKAKDTLNRLNNLRIRAYDEYPGGWTPQYEVTAISIKPNEMASCVSNEDGA